MNWIYALEKKEIDCINHTLYVEFLIFSGHNYEWKKANDKIMVFCMPENIIKFDVSTLKRNLVCQFMKAVHNCGFTTCDSLLYNALKLFDSASGRFIQIGKSEDFTVIDEKDSVDLCYFINLRCCDIVLSEIADSLNMKGIEQTFDFAS